MERFFGFDLGDAESAVSVLKKDKADVPQVLRIRGTKSFITAYARLSNQELIIGEDACYNPDAVERKLRFKSRFLTDRESETDVRRFAAGVLGELYQNGDLIQNEDCCFYIGCPAGWDRVTRERYRSIFERLGYPPVRIISESRAALVSACQSRYLQVGYDILSHPVLVVDIGSSTTDFAYIAGGREVELQTAGEVFLGGGIMDEILLEESLSASPDEKALRAVFAKSDAWHSYCEFAARRLKEKYFADEEYWKEHECLETVRVYYDRPLTLTLRMDAQTADRLLTKKCSHLDDRSFHEVFVASLKETRRHITGELPELIFLTGGVSRLSLIADWCREVYPEAVTITEAQPEFSVSRGLSYCGRIDEELRDFQKELDDFKDSTTVERIVAKNINDLYTRAVDALTGPIIENVVLPVIDRWREGDIRRLADIDEVLHKEIEAWLHSDEARQLLIKPVGQWLKPVAFEIEDYTVPICVKHNVPYRALSLTSYLALSDIDIHLDTKNVFAVEETTWMIDTIISILVGLLCGGSGIVLIAEGLPGIIAGAVISLLVLFLGKDRMQDALLRINIPMPVRKMLPKRYFKSRMDKLTDEIRKNFYDSLEKEKNDEISDRMVRDISSQIEDCLSKMARIIEIPLG